MAEAVGAVTLCGTEIVPVEPAAPAGELVGLGATVTVE